MIDRKKTLAYQEIHMPHFIEPQKHSLQNGLELFLLEGGDQELCCVELVFEAGSKRQQKTLQAGLCHALLLEGTQNKKSAEIHEELDFYGAYTQLDINSDRASVSLYTMNKYFAEVLPIFVDAIRGAIFPEDMFQIALQQKKQSYAINTEKVDFLARKDFFKSIFPKHPYGASAELADYDNIDVSDLRAFSKDFFQTSKLKVYLAGQLPTDGLELLNEQLGDWTLSSKDFDPIELSASKAEKIYTERDGALQSAIRIGRRTFNNHHEDYLQLKFLSVILGGYFGSRLMTNLREDKGLTYGIGAMMMGQEESGYFAIATEVNADSTKAALTEIYKELHRLREDLIPEEELHLVKNYVMGQLLKMADGPFSQVSILKNMHIQGFGFEFYDAYNEMLNNLDAEKLRAIAQKYLQEKDLTEVVVGRI